MTFVLLAVLVAVGDIFLKNHFEKELQWGEERRICGGKVLLCRYHNRGVALNIFEKRTGIIKYFCGGMLLFHPGICRGLFQLSDALELAEPDRF